MTTWPRRQVLHGASALTLEIQDADQVVDEPQIRVFWNREDVTSSFLRAAKWERPTSGQLRLHLEDVRLPASQDHEIVFSYRNEKSGGWVLRRLEKPTCSPYIDLVENLNYKRFAAFIADHASDSELATKIWTPAIERRMRPQFLAAWYLQESALNPMAVGKEQALGLAQLKPWHLSQLEKVPEDPYYPKVEQMSWLQLQGLVWLNELTPETDWRLQVEPVVDTSLDLIQSYVRQWEQFAQTKPFEFEWLQENRAIYTDLILASYKESLEQAAHSAELWGRDWLAAEGDPDLTSYIQTIKSRCYHMAAAASEGVRL